MKRNIKSLESTTFDVVIIGGGITGACLAHDAALRGMSVALLEKDDFGMSTSSASSKLLHGGVRYLQKLQFGKVRESARERTYFQVIAPHITKTIPFLVPTINGSLMKGKLALVAGMTAYRILCTGLNNLILDPLKKIPSGLLFNEAQVKEWVPLLKNVFGVTGAHTLYESHMNNSERMTLAFIKTAVKNGAMVANHTKVVGVCRGSSRITGVTCIDSISGKEFNVSGKVTINAAGPFLPGINNNIDGLTLHKDTTGFSKGVHLVTRQIEEKYALALSSGKKTEGLVTRGGRHIFIIPWRGHSLIGTTNVPFGNDLNNIKVTSCDVVEFLKDINAILPGVCLGESDVKYAFTGLYPLVSDEIKTDTYQGTGEYQVVDHSDHDKVEGFVSVLGAKYTTARAIAEQALDVVVKKLDIHYRKCKTASEPLSEGNIINFETFVSDKQDQYKNLVSAETIFDLVVSHGSNIDNVIDFLLTKDQYIEKISKNRETLLGEVAYAVEHEMAIELEDVVFARTGLGTIGHPGEDVLQKISQIMAELLGWTEKTRVEEIEKVNNRYIYK